VNAAEIQKEYDVLFEQLNVIDRQMQSLDTELVPYRRKLREAKSKAVTVGIYADSAWYLSTTQKVEDLELQLRNLGRQRQQVQQSVATLRRQLGKIIQADKDKDRERMFIQIAKEILSPDQYRSIWGMVDSKSAETRKMAEAYIAGKIERGGS
jgi:chaperonin cofactor prefoldin